VQSSSKLSPTLVALLVVALFASACSSGSDASNGAENQAERHQGDGGDTNRSQSEGTDGSATQGVTVRIQDSGEQSGDTQILITLDDASGDGAETIDRETTASGDPIDTEGVAQLLNRLPDLEAEALDQIDFNRPPDTRPRPIAGTTLKEDFPPETNADVPTVNSGPLEVLRFQPEGPVDLAPFISVTFNQPMVAISTVSQVELENVPISLTPEMPGRWIWLGTRTARFEYEPDAIDRIPAATNYVVEVPAGTTAANGAELADGVRFEFSTPTPQVTNVTPMNSSLATEPIFFIQFDQRVDPDAVLATIDLGADGQDVAIRLATANEVNEDAALASLAETALEGRWMAMRPVEPLPTNAQITLAIGPNVPSAEGPETSTGVESFSGRTYGPFAVEEARCGYDGCKPGQTFQIRMTNLIDTDVFTAEMVTVEPAIPGMQIGVSRNEITVSGRTSGRTDYTVTISSDLTDTFGQTLGDAVDERFRVDDADPALFRPGRSLVTLDPIVADQRLNVTSINNDELNMRVYQVDPATDWQDYLENSWEIARGEYQNEWPVLNEGTITIGGTANEFTETAVDLSGALESTGHVIVIIEPTRRSGDDYRNEAFAVWVQNTKLGLDAVADNETAVAWVTDLTTGDPIEGASVQMIGGGQGISDADGITRIALPNRARGMLVESNGDSALIGDFWAEKWDRNGDLRWYVIDDRGLYKPGETANLKGWVRQADSSVPADLSLPRSGSTVSWSAQDAFGNQIGSGEATLSVQGGFDFQVELPDDITLGGAGVQLSTNGFSNLNDSNSWHELRVQEFRRPDFEVSASVDDRGPYLAGEILTVDAQADYFAGGAIAASPVDWTVAGSATSYSPPNWPDYTFGVWVPWWLSYNQFGFGGGFDDDFGGGFGGSGTTEFFPGQTDAGGEHSLAVLVNTEGKPRPVSVTASATVTDVTRQPITGSTSALIHPAELYVGVRGARTFVQAGERLDLEVIVTDIDGTIAAGETVTVNSVRLEWQFTSGSWSEVEVPDEACEIETADEPMVCSFRPSEGGRYRMAATVQDGEGRTNLTELTRWVSGGTRPTSRQVNLEELTLIPSGQDFQPGDTAEILVQSPFNHAHGLLVISRGTIDRTETFEFDEAGTAIVRVPVTSDDIPGIGLQFEVAGTAPRSSNGTVDPELPDRPAFAAGQLTLSVPADERELTIEVAPRVEKLEPGTDTQIDVAVTDANGDPVADAELTVIVVDEAVLSLTNYQLRDPLDTFYQQSGGFSQTFRGRATLLLSDPQIETLDNAGGDTAAASADSDDAMDDDSMEEESMDMAMADEGGIAANSRALASPSAPTAQAAGSGQGEDKFGEPAIELRTDFDALAVFEPEVTTNADGKATIDVPLPDNLTRYRVMVVATADATNAGSGESNITARLPITVRPTPPRFANFGDVFEFPVIVQNATDDDLEVDVALRTTNLSVDGRDGTTVMVPANDRVEVRFEVSAVEAGTARYQVAASSGAFTDAADGELPVYTPATAEAFATYGVVDGGSVSQPFAEPQDVFPQFGGLEITTSSTAVAALTDAVIYMNEYRYESSDAFASRIIAIVSLDDILTAFEAEQLPSPDELRAMMTTDIARLQNLQNSDGGFPYWRRGRDSIPYNTVQATHALLLAEQAGYAVDEQVLANAKFYLANIEDFYTPWYSEPTKRFISAYALHVRDLAGDRDVQKATGLYTRAGDDIELDAAAWLWPVLADTEIDAEIELLLNNRVTETPNAATFATNYQEQAWVLLHSDRRTDAIVLSALVSQRPESDLVLKTLNGLLSARDRRGHWNNVQENSFVLLAGAAYFETFEDVDPSFIARAWLGETYTLEHDYEGRSTDRNLTIVPMAELVDVGDTDIVLARDGSDGRLYYRLGLRYAPTDFELEPRDQGFVVQRRYEAIDNNDDVVQADDGSWTVRAGARVRVRLTMVADSRRTHVALIDPIPAGFEIVNPALATSEPIPQADPSESTYSGYWWYRWFDHQNLRDDRAEAFSTWLGAGSYEYTYLARATTPGTFVTPPTRAEQIYEPEVFGRGASTTVTIVDS